MKQYSYYCFGFSILILIILGVKNRWFIGVSLPKRHRKNGWERLRGVPDWVYKKMKRRRTNYVNGDHYRYKREGNNYYRKKK